MKLFPYQEKAAQWLSTKKVALLSLEMGLGKTAVSITASRICETNNLLVICPAVAIQNWKRELGMWWPGFENFTLSSYDQAHKLLETSSQWDTLILDEAHYLKSIDAKRTQTIYGKNGLVRRVSRTWCVTGTPCPNHAGELWPMLYTFGQTGLRYEEFTKRFCRGRTIKVGQRYIDQITGTRMENIPELRKILEPITYRKTLSDTDVGIQLPPIHFDIVTLPPGKVCPDEDISLVQYYTPVNRSEELFKILERERDLVKTVMGNISVRSEQSVKAIQALMPAVPTLRKWIGLQKIEPVLEMVNAELKDGVYNKIVIFAFHRTVIEALRRGLRRWNAVTLYGNTDPLSRQRNIDRFQTHSNCRVFIGNIHAAGTAINLTAADNVLFVELDWVPANNAQAAKRCHRIGQTKPVFVRFVSTDSSIDEKIVQVVFKKTYEISCLMDGVPTRHQFDKVRSVKDLF